MKDEIKEILFLLHNDRLTDSGKRKLEEYITNLEQKIKHYEETQTFGDYVKEVNLLIDYKQRIDKAIEYIENNLYSNGSGDVHGSDLPYDETIQPLLNILTGGDEE